MNEDQEFEVTPEMIEAGATILARWHPDFETVEDGADRIFRAMRSIEQTPKINALLDFARETVLNISGVAAELADCERRAIEHLKMVDRVFSDGD